MEAIRKAAGAAKLTLFGISYGTELALAYARAYPQRVERLILDSVVDPDERDAVRARRLPRHGADAALALPAGLRDGRSGGRARRARRLAARGAAARRGPHRAGEDRCGGRCGPWRSPTCSTTRTTRPALRAGLPAAVRAARARRRGAAAAAAAHLRRASRRRRRPRTSPPPATPRSARRRRCRGRAGRRSPSAARSRRAGAAALGPAAFFPFDADVAFADEIELCLRWPDPGQPPRAPGGPYPDVPGAAAAGRGGHPHAAGGLRARRDAVPARDAGERAGRRARRRRRRSRATAGSGSSSAGWTASAVRARCPRVATDVPAVTVPPTSFGAVAPARGVAGSGGDVRVRRTVGALDATLADLALRGLPGRLRRRPGRRPARRHAPARRRGPARASTRSRSCRACG